MKFSEMPATWATGLQLAEMGLKPAPGQKPISTLWHNAGGNIGWVEVDKVWKIEDAESEAQNDL
jgi:hypothetical protein